MAAIVVFQLFFLLVTILSNYFVAINGGFTVELIRPDSLKSPFYNPNKTHADRLNKIFQQSMKKSSPNTPQSQITAYKGQHLMKLSIGTPPVDIIGLADTGSDLFWTQCVPCNGCYKQIDPIFNPRMSSTYSNISCLSKQCQLVGTGSCSPSNLCNYTYGYGDNSLTQGVLAKEKVTLTSTSGQPVSLDIVFGCGHNDTGSFNDHEMGLIGLGGGSVSLISQIGSTFGGRKFSLCLAPFGTDPSITSKMSFGNGSEVLGDGVVSTPLVAKEDSTPYFVTVEGISVGDTYVPFNSSGVVSKGNMLLDSGTPPILLPQDFYDRLVAEVKRQISLSPIEGDSDLGSQLCYRSEANLDGPILTVHFEGANVKLNPINTFIPPPEEGVFCFAMNIFGGDGGVFGNFAQANFLIGYDMETMTISFKPTDCTK